MLDKFLNENEFIAVLFINEDCTECEDVLKELENIGKSAKVLNKKKSISNHLLFILFNIR